MTHTGTTDQPLLPGLPQQQQPLIGSNNTQQVSVKDEDDDNSIESVLQDLFATDQEQPLNKKPKLEDLPSTPTTTAPPQINCLTSGKLLTVWAKEIILKGVFTITPYCEGVR